MKTYRFAISVVLCASCLFLAGCEQKKSFGEQAYEDGFDAGFRAACEAIEEEVIKDISNYLDEPNYNYKQKAYDALDQFYVIKSRRFYYMNDNPYCDPYNHDDFYNPW